jgi:pimeloyl-ACP methyl ester carboxylesterase
VAGRHRVTIGSVSDGTPSPRAQAWLGRGSFYSWSPAPGETEEIQIFHVEAGDPDAPLVVLAHGFPTSSLDWFDVIDQLAERYRVSAFDFPGYGFSDKPRDWAYSLSLDADLLLHHVRRVLGAQHCRLVAHDRGDSVALLTHHRLVTHEDVSPVIDHLVLTNGNVFLPLASLTDFQKRLLDPDLAQTTLELVTPELLGEGLGSATFTPPRPANDPTVAGLVTTFAHHDGIAVLGETIQYLRERAEHELTWLRSLATSSVPATLVWGICDTVAPPRVAMHVWDHYLVHKPGSNELWFVPGANHYLQNDRPREVVEALVRSFERTGPEHPGALGGGALTPLRIDHSRSRLPSTSDVFRL